MSSTILHLDSSARMSGSVSRQLTQKIVDRLSKPGTRVIRRDVGAEPPPFVTEAWIGANFTDEAQRSDAQNDLLSLSEQLIGELEQADTYVLGVPMYNFGVPAAFKAWIDQVARARKTFRYGETGPVGLLENKRAILVVTTGGTRTGTEIDFTTGYLRHILGFLGVSDVETIVADQLMLAPEESLAAAEKAAAALDV